MSDPSSPDPSKASPYERKLAKELGRTIAALEAQEKKATGLAKDVGRLTEELGRVSQERDAELKRATALEEKEKALQAYNQGLEKALTLLWENHAAEQQRRVETAVSQRTEFDRERDEARAERNTLRAEIDALREETQRLQQGDLEREAAWQSERRAQEEALTAERAEAGKIHAAVLAQRDQDHAEALGEQKVRAERLVEELASIMAECKRLRAEREALLADKARLEYERHRASEAHESALARLADQKEQGAQLASQVVEVQAQRAELRAALDALAFRHQTALDEQVQLRERTLALEASGQQHAAAWQEERLARAAALSAAQAEAGQRQTELHDLQHAHEELVGMHEHQCDLLACVQQELAEHKARGEALTTQRDMATGDRDAARQERDDLRATLTAAQAEQRVAQEQAGEQRAAELAARQMEYRESLSQRDQHHSEVLRLTEARAEVLQQDLTTIKAERDKLRADLDHEHQGGLETRAHLASKDVELHRKEEELRKKSKDEEEAQRSRERLARLLIDQRMDGELLVRLEQELYSTRNQARRGA